MNDWKVHKYREKTVSWTEGVCRSRALTWCGIKVPLFDTHRQWRYVTCERCLAKKPKVVRFGVGRVTRIANDG